jgi:hypothetical protein
VLRRARGGWLGGWLLPLNHRRVQNNLGLAPQVHTLVLQLLAHLSVEPVVLSDVRAAGGVPLLMQLLRQQALAAAKGGARWAAALPVGCCTHACRAGGMRPDSGIHPVYQNRGYAPVGGEEGGMYAGARLRQASSHPARCAPCADALRPAMPRRRRGPLALLRPRRCARQHEDAGGAAIELLAAVAGSHPEASAQLRQQPLVAEVLDALDAAHGREGSPHRASLRRLEAIVA